MTWIKLDDTFPDDPKVIGLTDSAYRLYVSSLCYCARHLTDGHVPRAALVLLRCRRSAQAVLSLCSVGLWTEHESDGWVVHNYLEWQRSKEQVEAERDGAKQRKAAQRERQRKTTPKASVTEKSRRDSVTRHGGSHAVREEKSQNSSSSSSVTEAGDLANVAAYGGEDELLRQTFALMARTDLANAKNDGVTIHTTTGFLAAAAQRRREEHAHDAQHHLANHPTSIHYPLHIELAELIDPACGPDDGGLARSKAKSNSARLAREAEAADRGPRSNAGAAAARIALATPNQTATQPPQKNLA